MNNDIRHSIKTIRQGDSIRIGDVRYVVDTIDGDSVALRVCDLPEGCEVHRAEHAVTARELQAMSEQTYAGEQARRAAEGEDDPS